MTELSIVIPARNEQFLKNTVEDILAHIEADTDIIVVLDGQWAEPELVQHPKVTVIYHPESIGQRAACNEAVKVSTAKYVAKVDAHCAFDQGFDVKLLADMHDNWTCAPTMRNLHVFDWVCPNGHRRYQGPDDPCKECNEPMVMDIVWIPKRSPQSNSYCFDSEPHFQYFGEYNKRPEGQGDLTESMSLQGSFFMMSRQRYLDLNVCDEAWGSWGSQGAEIALKSWLSGGKVMINHKTWDAHCFRTQGRSFGFPYHLSGRQVEHAKRMARETFLEGKRIWPNQILPTSWLIEKFWPVKGWSDEDLAKLKKKEAA